MKYLKFVIGVLLITLVASLLSCATDKAPLQIQNSLPQQELAYYSDSFDKMREDLWDKAGYLFRKEQAQNFKQAEMRFVNGKLIIQTKTGSFSKGGFGSKYTLRRDFDIQLDCRIDLKKGISGMDQLFIFNALDSTQKKDKSNIAIIGLVKEGGNSSGYLFSDSVVNGRGKRGKFQETENFNGAFRILRTGKNISTLYKRTGATDWTKMNTFRITDKDILVGFHLRNFNLKRTTIRADNSISVEVDRYVINAAQGIIEEDI